MSQHPIVVTIILYVIVQNQFGEEIDVKIQGVIYEFGELLQQSEERKWFYDLDCEVISATEMQNGGGRFSQELRSFEVQL